MDVAVERQVEITGPDAAKFVQMLTPRNLSTCRVVQIYLIQMRRGHFKRSNFAAIGENHFWISLADSDVLFWAQGVAVHSGLDVQIHEPDITPSTAGPEIG